MGLFYRIVGYGLTATGAATGASVGKAGIVVVGTGYSVGTLPLVGAGALTGLALYEVITIVLEKDSSSLGAAGIGAVAGAGVCASIGGVGVSAGGMAIGAGMVSMTAAGAVVGLGIAGLSRLLWQQDIEKLLDQAILDMQEDLVKFRQAVVSAIASQKRTQQQYNQNQLQANQWQSRARLALRKGDENLAREALKRRKSHLETANTIKQTLDQQTAQVETLKRKLTIFESEVTEAKAKKHTLKARIQAVKATKSIESMIGGINPSGATAAFERMEEKVLQMEAKSQAAGELVGSDVDDELAAMKAQLSGASPNPAQLPQSSQAEDPEKILDQAIIDMSEDLVQLRRAVAQSIATQKRSQQQYNQNQSQANKCQSYAQLALQKGDENLARKALRRKKSYLETANTIKATLDQ